MVGQALLIKSDIETRRAAVNGYQTFGIIVWQFNEIWPTGGCTHARNSHHLGDFLGTFLTDCFWCRQGAPSSTALSRTPRARSSVAAGSRCTVSPQLLPPLVLHFSVPGTCNDRSFRTADWYKKTIFADVMATCGTVGPDANSTDSMLALADGSVNSFAAGASCYVKNDSPMPFKGTVEVSSVSLATGKATSKKKLALNMPAGAGVMQWFDVPGAIDGTTEMLIVVVTDSDGTVTSNNPVPFALPKDMKLKKTDVKVTVAATEQQLAPGAPVEVTLTSDALALYVTLTTLAQGRFEDNAFVMMPGTKTVKFFPFEGFELAELNSSIRVEHTATYM